MRDQASRTEPFPPAAEVLQAGISDKGTCSHASHELPSKAPQVSPTGTPATRAEGAQHHGKFLWADFIVGGLTRRVNPCSDLSTHSMLHGKVPRSRVLS